tara:strand:- start:737 stop:928 length:192 start_codon:yes stop_codon:yes gene_type:complete
MKPSRLIMHTLSLQTLAKIRDLDTFTQDETELPYELEMNVRFIVNAAERLRDRFGIPITHEAR